MNRIRLGLLALLGLAGTVPAAPVSARKEGTTPYIPWSVVSDSIKNEMHDPLVVNGLVVVGTDKGELRAYRTDTGKEAWDYSHGKRIFHRPSSDGERVFFAAEGGLTAVTADAGKPVWSFEPAGDAPTLALREKGLVYAASSDGSLYALDAKSGEKRWAVDFVADAPPDPPGFAGDQFREAPRKARPTALASDGEAVYLSVFDQCRVVAFSAATGKRLWSYQTGGWVWGTAVATPTHVFIGSQDKCFHGLDKKTGKPVWTFQTKGRVEAGGAVDDKCVYFGSCDGGVYCLGQVDGKERWKFETERYEGGKRSAIYSVPILRNGTVCIAAGEGQVYGIVAGTGELRWKIRAEGNSDLFCSPASDGQSFFVTTRPGFPAKGRPAPGVSALVAISLK